MNKLHAPTFEATDLLTVNAGALDVTIIPIAGSPDWVVPTSLIIGTQPCDTMIQQYAWGDIEIGVVAMLPKDMTPETLIVLSRGEGNEPIGLLVSGAIERRPIKIADIDDSEFSDTSTTYPYVFQPVSIENTIYIVPDMQAVADSLSLTK